MYSLDTGLELFSGISADLYQVVFLVYWKSHQY